MKNNFDLVKEVCNFLYDHGSKYSHWNPKELWDYVDYYERTGAMGIIREQGKIVGVGMARTINLLNFEEQSKNPWYFAPFGDVLYIQEICVSKTKAIPRLWDQMVERFGVKQFAAGKRHGKSRIWKFNKYQEKVFKLESVG